VGLLPPEPPPSFLIHQCCSAKASLTFWTGSFFLGMGAGLCPVGYLGASPTSTHYPSPVVRTKNVSRRGHRCLLGVKCTPAENHRRHQVWFAGIVCKSAHCQGACQGEVRSTGWAPCCQGHWILSFCPHMTSFGLGYKQISTCPASQWGCGKIQRKAQTFLLPLKNQQTLKHKRVGGGPRCAPGG